MGFFPPRVYTMTSENYQINSDSINIGGVEQNSASYRSQDTIGEGASGEAQSGSYKINSGWQATWDYPPGFSFAINDNDAALGTLSTTAAATDTTTFSVSTNAAAGYVVSISGNTLTSVTGPDNIDALASPAASSPGSEQFGINLVDNSSPDVGANPSGGSGTAATDYDTANNFKFVSGDTIAQNNIYSPNTTFTISYVGNMSNITVAGNYAATLTLIATGKF